MEGLVEKKNVADGRENAKGTVCYYLYIYRTWRSFTHCRSLGAFAGG
jgi:hypothetical protein